MKTPKVNLRRMLSLRNRTKYQAEPETLQSRTNRPLKQRIDWKKSAKRKRGMKQYGDKGYKPSSGKGVGY